MAAGPSSDPADKPVTPLVSWNLLQLGLPADNWEVVLAAPLADGRPSLLLATDDNFNPLQRSLLARLVPRQIEGCRSTGQRSSKASHEPLHAQASQAAAAAGDRGRRKRRRPGLPLLGAHASGSSGKAALPFVPVRAPLPLPSDGLSAAEQRQVFREFSVEDKLLVPQGYRADLIASWGDRLAAGRFGFNNDYLALLPLTSTRALLSVNFEYISPLSWAAGYGEAVGTPLPWSPCSRPWRAAGAASMLPTWGRMIRCSR